MSEVRRTQTKGIPNKPLNGYRYVGTWTVFHVTRDATRFISTSVMALWRDVCDTSVGVLQLREDELTMAGFVAFSKSLYAVWCFQESGNHDDFHAFIQAHQVSAKWFERIAESSPPALVNDNHYSSSTAAFVSVDGVNFCTAENWKEMYSHKFSGKNLYSHKFNRT